MNSSFLGFLRLIVAIALCVGAGLPTAPRVLAEPPAASDAMRVFILPAQGNGDAARALTSGAPFFESVLSRTGRFTFAGTQDQEVVFSQCRGDLAISPAQARECQLNAARRSFVKWVLEFAIQSNGGRDYQLTVNVWNPTEAQKEFTDVVEVQATSMGGAARKGMEQLAHRFLQSRLVGLETPDGQPASPTPAPTPGGRATPSPGGAAAPAAGTDGRLEVLGLEPATAKVRVNGREVGTGPGQYFNLPTGEVQVQFTADGHQPVNRTVNLVAGRLEILSGVRLDREPGTVVVTCNIEDARILVDGNEVGRTRRGAAISIDVPPTSAILEVRRDGYAVFLQNLTLRPGARQAFEVSLQAQTDAGAGRVASARSVPFAMAAGTAAFSATGTAAMDTAGPDGCTGKFGSAPHFVMTLQRATPVRVIARSRSGDLSLMLQGPAGTVCDDDSAGNLDPQVEQTLEPGTYRVFVGQVSGDAPLEFAFSAEPFDPRSNGDGPAFTMANRAFDCSQATYPCVEVSPSAADGIVSQGSSGGQIRAPGNCSGTIAEKPDHLLLVNEPGDLMAAVLSDADTTLVIDGPGGLRCDDDTNGTNPAVSGHFERGTYRVWVGSYEGGSINPYRIAFGPTGVVRPAIVGAIQQQQQQPVAAAPGAGSRAYNCSDSTFQCLSVSPADPSTVLSVTGASGGSNVAPGQCRGHIGSSPDHVLVVGSRIPFLRLGIARAENDGDTTLVVDGPGGLRCGDDEDGNKPVVQGAFEPGTYRIWVGTYSDATMLSYTLTASQAAGAVNSGAGAATGLRTSPPVGGTQSYDCSDSTFDCIAVSASSSATAQVTGASGGSNIAPGQCRGHIGSSPDHILVVRDAVSDLRLAVTSAENNGDTTLVVDGPGGLRCGDDEDGNKPAVQGSFGPGVYRIWIGTYADSTMLSYTLTASRGGSGGGPVAAPANTPSGSQSYDCSESTFDCIAVSPSDHTPVLVTGASGGSNSAPGNCRGHIGNSPDHVLVVREFVPRLRIAVTRTENDGDTTLVVSGPNGLLCGDDEDGTKPVVEGGFAPGVYRIWVGTYSDATMLSYTLSVTQ